MNKNHTRIVNWFECSCYAPEHALRFLLDDWSDNNIKDVELYCEIHLTNYKNILQRIWYALRYICNYKCRYGCFDGWSMNEEDVKKLRNLLDEYEIRKNTTVVK